MVLTQRATFWLPSLFLLLFDLVAPRYPEHPEHPEHPNTPNTMNSSGPFTPKDKRDEKVGKIDSLRETLEEIVMLPRGMLLF